MGVAFQLSQGEPGIVPGGVWRHGFPTWLSWPAATLNLFSSQEPSLCWIQNSLYPLRWSGQPGQWHTGSLHGSRAKFRQESFLVRGGPHSAGGPPPGRETQPCERPRATRASLHPEPQSRTVRKPEAAAAGSWAGAGGGGVSVLRMCSAGEHRKGRVSQLLVSELFFLLFLSFLSF